MPRKSKKKLSAKANAFVPGATYVSSTASSITSSPFIAGSATTQSISTSPPMSTSDESIVSSSSIASTPAVLEPFQMNWTYNAPKSLSFCLIMGPPGAECPLINTSYQIAHLVDTICALPLDPLGGEGFPKLFCDLEGTNLSREGTVSLMQICILPERPFASPSDRLAALKPGCGVSAQHGSAEDNSNASTSTTTLIPAPPASVYVLDIHHLGSVAFRTFGIKHPTTTLLSILENPLIPKVFFDVRNDSNALFGHYGVRLQAVHDLQCMEAAMGMKGRIIGLGKCLKYLHIRDDRRRGGEEFEETSLNDEEAGAVEATSERGKRAFAPEKGGSYEVFKLRPLPQSMLAYAISDVVLMPGIYARFRHTMEGWEKNCVKPFDKMPGANVGEYLWNVFNASKHRVWLSQQDDYQSQGLAKLLNPWMTAATHTPDLNGRRHDFKDGIEWMYVHQVLDQIQEAQKATVGGRPVVTEAFADQVEMVSRREKRERQVEMQLRGALIPPEQSW